MSLPNGYRRLEYIKSTGTQWIDSGVVATQSIGFEIDFSTENAVSTSGHGTIFGVYIASRNRYEFGTYPDTSGGKFLYGGTINNPHLVSGSRIQISFLNNVLTTPNGSENISTQTFNTGKTFAIFGRKGENNGVLELSKTDIYALKFYDNGTLVRDFIPCQKPDGTIGLWDDVNSAFYGNAGTGTFISGGYTSLEVGDVFNYAYTGAVQSVTLPKGVYKLEVWGAQGGYRSSSTYGGKGGYSVGTITLTKETNVYVYVGGSGNTGGTSGGFNGGGARRTYKGGGGASDIRIGQDSLYARVIVAGGGGSDGAKNKKGMYGGGTAGGSTSESFGTGGYGGTQTGVSSSSWQTTAHSTSTTTQAGAYAGFGFGGNGIYRSNSAGGAGGYGGAGGGGWYGGSGSYPDPSGDDDRGGGGGSGFVWTGSNAPSGYLLGSKYYLTNASTIAGNASMPSISGGTETGHTGNGYARITVIKTSSLNLPVNIGGAWKDANEAFVNIGGTWKTVEAAFVNIDGTWKELG